MTTFRPRIFQRVTDTTRYGQTNPYLYTNFMLMGGIGGQSTSTNSFNFTERSEFLYDPFDAIRLIMRRHISNAVRIYPNIRVVEKNGYRLPVDCSYQPDRINVEIENDIVTKIIGLF